MSKIANSSYQTQGAKFKLGRNNTLYTVEIEKEKCEGLVIKNKEEGKGG